MRLMTRDPAERAGHTTPATPGAPDVPPARAPRPREARDAVLTELLVELARMRQTNTELLGHLRGQIVNNVLDVETLTIGQGGNASREFRATVGTVEVVNLAITGCVTVMSGPEGSSAPATGKALVVIPAGGSRVVNIASHAFTVYGPVGATVTVQAFTKAHPPAGTAGTPTTPLRPGTPLDITATAATGGAASAILAATPGKTTWITGWTVTWDTTATGTVGDVVTVTSGATVLTYLITTVAGAGGTLSMVYPEPIPSTAVGVATTVSLPATASRAGARITAHGFAT